MARAASRGEGATEANDPFVSELLAEVVIVHNDSLSAVRVQRVMISTHEPVSNTLLAAW